MIIINVYGFYYCLSDNYMLFFNLQHFNRITIFFISYVFSMLNLHYRHRSFIPLLYLNIYG